MSRFYAEIKGNRGEATRMGSKDSGIFGHIRGWEVGIRVQGVADGENDKFNVYLTAGSTGGQNDLYIGTAKKIDGELFFDDLKE